MRPTKADFPNFLAFTQNISDLNIDPHIKDAFKFDIRPKLGTSLANDIYNYSTVGDYDPADYDENDYALETKPQLTAFYYDFVLQWWVLLATRRFLQIHGYNITQFGLTKMIDSTFEQMTPAERSIQAKQIMSDADVLYSDILRETWTFDGVTYRKPGSDSCTTPNRGSFGISAIE